MMINVNVNVIPFVETMIVKRSLLTYRTYEYVYVLTNGLMDG